MAAGTALVGAGALGAGIYGSIRLRRALLGHARAEHDLSERELRVIEAAARLDKAVRLSLEEGTPDRREAALLSRVALRPLIASVRSAFDEGTFDDMTTYNRARLRGHVNNLRYLADRLERHALPS